MFTNRLPPGRHFTLSLALVALRPFARVNRFAEVGRAGMLVRAAELQGSALASSALASSAAQERARS